MGRKALKAVVFSLLALALVSAAGAAFVYWRLSSGPVALNFMQGAIEQGINAQLGGINVTLSDTVLELDAKTRIPSVRARNIVLRDAAGQTLATSPKLAVTLDPAAILRGKVVVKSLGLIGTRIDARRNLDGTVALGIGEQAAAADEVTVVTEGDIEAASPEEQAGAQPRGTLPAGNRIVEILAAEGGASALSQLDVISMSDAAVTFYDEANDATWEAPHAELSFRRMPYGFLVTANADVASGDKPWKVDVSAAYQRDEKRYAVTAKFGNLVPAHVADKVFALSQFARFGMPLSGQLDLGVSQTGVITEAKGEIRAAAGELNFPGYFAKPIEIDEGAFKLAYDAEANIISLDNSSLLVGGTLTEVGGTLTAQRLEDGRLTAFSMDLLARTADSAPQNAVDIDRIEFKGSASVETARVQIDDLVVMAGETGVRLRGVISGGEESAGIQVAGRLRDVSVDLLKQLWPPILAPNTRSWVNEHVTEGNIPQGTFQVNFPANALAKALRERQVPDNAVDVSFDMSGVTSTYFKSLPPLRNASGSVRLKDSVFEMKIDGGEASLESGKSVRLREGSFIAAPLMKDEVPGTFAFDIEGPIDSMLAFAGHPDLNMAPAAASEAPRLEGTARAKIGLKLPLIKAVPRSRVEVTTTVSLKDTKVAGAMPGIDLTAGQFAVETTDKQITVSGPARLNGNSAEIVWRKPRGDGPATTIVETVVDAEMREKLGLKIEDYIKGDVPVKITVGPPGEEGRKVSVEADLSGVAMRLTAAGWSRKATKGTKASFEVIDLGKGNRRIEDIQVDGPNLRLRGSLAAKDGQFTSIRATEIRLEEDDTFSATLTPGDGVMNLEVAGTSIDARPYIKQLVSPQRNPEAGTSPPKGQNFIVTARFDKVLAHRGEQITDVKATFLTRRGSITTANIEGLFKSGKPVTIRLTPTDGGRELRVASIDGGAVLRATDFYGKIAGGQLEFYALIGNSPGAPIQNGRLVIDRFEVRDEAALAELDARGRPKKSGPRRGGVYFRKLSLPFTADSKFVRLCKVSLRGPDMGATASGVIRKSDSAIDITGTYIPAYGLNAAVGEIPLLGDILTGGNREGVLGITYAMGGTLTKPEYQFNPLSFLAPGILRKMFEYEQKACRDKPRQSQQIQSNSN